MKKISIIAAFSVVLLFGASGESFAQRGDGPVTPFRVGSVTLNLGVGIGSEYKGNYYGGAFGTKAAVEFGLWQAGPGVISLGFQGGASFSTKSPYNYYNDYRSRTVVIAGRSAWHYGWKVKGLDTYAGLSAGVGFHSNEYVNNNNNGNQRYDDDQVIPVLGAFVGASYFITPRFGFNAEAGYDITSLQAGIIFKLR